MVHRTEALAKFAHLLWVLLFLTAKPGTNDSLPVLLGEDTRVEYVKRGALVFTKRSTAALLHWDIDCIYLQLIKFFFFFFAQTEQCLSGKFPLIQDEFDLRSTCILGILDILLEELYIEVAGLLKY